MFEFKDDKYIIFLQDRFFKKHWFKSYKKVIKSLENNGVTVVSCSDIIEFQKVMKYPLLFDDKTMPELNCLYIHLYNATYYNDAIYVKKKIEKEREMLLLLAGKLGVHKMTYSSTITETSISNIEALLLVKGFDNKVKYTKNKSVKNSATGCEIYQNRGASVYLKSKSREALDDNILKSLSKMKSKIFSFDYYKNSPKLESFVYKRFVFKMLHIEYTIDVEDISEKSFIVKSCLMNYGFGISVNNNISYTETITFEFDFFTDKDLRLELLEYNRKEKDEFIMIREVYDDTQDKNAAVHHIANYVRELSNEMKYTLNDCKEVKEKYTNILNKWIQIKGIGHFYSECHNFTNTFQIKDWIINIITPIVITVIEDENIKEDKNKNTSYLFKILNRNKQKKGQEKDTDSIISKHSLKCDEEEEEDYDSIKSKDSSTGDHIMNQGEEDSIISKDSTV